MKKIFILIFILFSTAAFALNSTPEAFIPASGSMQSSNFISFIVLGDNAAGIVSSASFTSGIGLSPAIFSPLLPQAGQLVPSIPTPEGEVVIYPNPFNPQTGQAITISYKLAQDTQVKVYIFDITGQLVRIIIADSSNRGADGYSRVLWDGRSGFDELVENGVYLTQIVADGRLLAKTKVMVLH